MIKKPLLYIILLFLFPGQVISQEIVIGLQSNQLLKQNTANISLIKGLAADTLELPLFDDFSGQEVFPDSKIWSDNYVLINNTYSDRQITAGIATFDALNNLGRLYETASPTGFEADHLTSQPVNLNLPATDNIRLSFFYQPGGLADMPEENDSLTLQFFAPSENKWYSVWKNKNISNSGFKAVIIKIDQPRYSEKRISFPFHKLCKP